MAPIQAFVGRRTLRGAPGESVRTQQNSARKGFAAVLDTYTRLVEHIIEQEPQVLLEALQPAFDKSQEYCPRDTGALAKSGYLAVVQWRGHPTVQIGYGRGGEPDYAVTVHENLEWRHKAPTRAKWLQVALEEASPEIQGRIVSGLKKAGGFK